MWAFIPRESEGRTIYFTDEQEENIRRQWEKNTIALVYSRTKEGKEYLKYSLARRDYKFERLDEEQDGTQKWICGYGTRHFLSAKCVCPLEYGTMPYELLFWAQENYKINHSHELTDYMRKEFLNVKSLVNSRLV